MSFIGLLEGEPGSGKTMGAYSFPEPICHILLENREKFCRDLANIYYPNKMIDIKTCYVVGGSGIFTSNDPVRSVGILRKTYEELDLSKYQTIIIDHAGKIRKWLKDEWRIKHPRNGKPAKQVWPLDEYWSINENTRGYLNGLINFGIEHSKNIVFTTTFKDNYGEVVNDKGKKVPAKIGRVTELDDFIDADVDWIVTLSLEQGRYIANIRKSIVGFRKLDVTGKGTKLYRTLMEQK